MRVIFTFDTYGTLIDWLGGIKITLRKLFNMDNEQTTRFIDIWGKYDYRLVQINYKPYREILYLSFKNTLDEMDVKYTDELLWDLVYSIKTWPPFPDTMENLLRLKKLGEIGIISNTDREFIQASVKNIGVEFDHIVVAEDIKLYKPDPRVFNKASKIIGVTANDKWFHISSYHKYDIIPAKKSGEKIITILLDRYGYKMEAGKYSDYVYEKFDELVEKVSMLI